MYLYLKALHIIFVITWFAGLFYIVRLFIYQTEANKKPNLKERQVLSEHLALMAKRLWTMIAWPSMILATTFAICLLVLNPGLLTQGWMHLKLGFVILLIGYHFYCHSIYKHLQNEKYKYSSEFLRLFNEGPTLVLFSVIFLVVLRDSINWIYGVVGLFVLAGVLMLGVKWYKHIRDKS